LATVIQAEMTEELPATTPAAAIPVVTPVVILEEIPAAIPVVIQEGIQVETLEETIPRPGSSRREWVSDRSPFRPA
jgi:hypothetical protein